MIKDCEEAFSVFCFDDGDRDDDGDVGDDDGDADGDADGDEEGIDDASSAGTGEKTADWVWW